VLLTTIATMTMAVTIEVTMVVAMGYGWEMTEVREAKATAAAVTTTLRTAIMTTAAAASPKHVGSSTTFQVQTQLPLLL
jgi:hypothetical protein